MTDKEIIKEQANIDISNLHIAQKQGIITEFGKGKLEALEGIVNFIDSMQEELISEDLEEADLEKHLKEDIEDVFFDLDGVAVKGATHYITVEDVKDIAKHFFELGLKAKNWEILVLT